jgi:hypothetical protein
MPMVSNWRLAVSSVPGPAPAHVHQRLVVVGDRPQWKREQELRQLGPQLAPEAEVVTEGPVLDDALGDEVELLGALD